MGLTSRQRKIKQAKNKIRELLNKHNLEGSVAWTSFSSRRFGSYDIEFIIFPPDHYMSDPTIKIFCDAEQILKTIQIDDEKISISIYDVDDKLRFEDFDEYRKHMLIKKLSYI